jgi:hypothetical protein
MKLSGFLTSVVLAAGVAVASTEAPIELPVSFDKVWYRPAIKSGFGSGKQTGLLTVTVDGIEFSSDKRSDFLPWSRVEMVSYGRMPGDPDTKWVVLGLEPVAGEWHYAGLRDGSRMGYGSRTVPIFDAVIEGMRRAKAGPYDVPEGQVPFITRFLQFSLALPEGWSSFEVSHTMVDGWPVWGRTIFSPTDLNDLRGDAPRLKEALAAIERGSATAVQLDRLQAGEGFSCELMKKTGRRLLDDEIALALRPYVLTAEPQWQARQHRACTAWTATANASKGETAIALRMFAVSDGQTVFLFTARGDAVDQDRFDALTRSLRTMVAR